VRTASASARTTGSIRWRLCLGGLLNYYGARRMIAVRLPNLGHPIGRPTDRHFATVHERATNF